MLEIVFDENQNNLFLGQSYSHVKIEAPVEFSFAAYRLAAARFVEAYAEQPVVLVDFLGNEEERNYFALALSVETYREDNCLESVVFKIKDRNESFAEYRPFGALANSIRYARDLFCMEENEMYADIKRLGYLGLKIKEDYLKNEIIMEWPGSGDVIEFCSQGKSETAMYVGVVKALAIIRHPAALRLTIKRGLIGAEIHEDELISNIVNMVRNENEKR